MDLCNRESKGESGRGGSVSCSWRQTRCRSPSNSARTTRPSNQYKDKIKLKETGLPLTGRQQMHMAYESYATEAEEGAMHTREDIYMHRLTNGDHVSYRNGIKGLLAGMDPDVPLSQSQLDYAQAASSL